MAQVSQARNMRINVPSIRICMPKGGGGELRCLDPKNIKEFQFTLL